MENKEKQIEEMEQYLVQAIVCSKSWKPRDIIEHLTKMIIPNDNVILSGLELADYKHYKEYTKSLARVEKETSEKWYNEVKKLYLENTGEQVFEHNWFGVQLNRFAKQCGVEIKEN